MRRDDVRRSQLLSAVGLLALTCIACTPGAVGPGYRGEPLFTVKGQLVTPGAVPTTPIRLAIAWYPDEESSTAPRAIVTQEVQYQGSFPLNYSFSFFSVPPQGVLIEYRDGDELTRAAFGVLLAYEDVNGNGQLDSIPAGGSGLDRVLGTSVGDTYNGNPEASPIWVAFVDGTPGRRWTGYSPGYNLWRASTRDVVPADTAVPIALHATNELNFFVCEEFISGSSYGFDLPCNVTPTGGVRVIGNLYRQNGVAGASLRITDGVRPLPGLLVEVNDAGVPYDPPSGLYGASGTVPLVTPGFNTVRVTAPNQPPLVFSIEAPGEFTLRAPREGTKLLTGTSLVVDWTRSSGAAFYQAQAYALTPPNPGTEPVLVSDFGEQTFSARLTGFTQDDTHEVLVSAFARRYLAHGRGGSLVNVATSRSEYLDVLPADAGVWLEGSVLVSTYQGQTGGSAWMQAFDGVTLVSTALVTANGEALTWDARQQQYGGAVQVQAGETATLGVTLPGRPRRTYEVALPSAFTVTTPPRSHPTRTALPLTWTAAPGATEYRVYVSDATGRSLHFEGLLGTAATVPPLDVVGDVIVTVSAARIGASRHFAGLVQASFDVTLTP